MITKYVKPVEMIVKGKREIKKEATGQEIPNGLQIVHILDRKIFING